MADKIKICVLGNSHVASLKMGWELIRNEYKQMNLTFFAQRQSGLNGLVLRNGLLVPNNEELKRAISYTSGGLEFIDINDFDFCLLYGLGVRPYIAYSDQFFSKAVIELLAKDWCSNTLTARLLTMIRKISDIKTFVGHPPLPGAADSTSSADVNRYFTGIEIFNNYLFSKYSARLLGQPEETIFNGLYTKNEYASGSRRLDVGDAISNQLHPDGERDHMNGLFGALYLKDLFDVINKQN